MSFETRGMPKCPKRPNYLCDIRSIHFMMFILPLNCGLYNLNFLKRAQQLLRWRPCQSKVGRKAGGGGYCAPFHGGAGSSSNTISPGPRPPYEVASWSIQSFGHRRGPKSGGGLLCPFLGELGPHLTQCGLGWGLYLRTKWHSNISNGLATIHQRYTDRQTGQTDNGPISKGEPF